MLKILSIVLLILAFFFPMTASWIYIGIIVTVEASLLILSRKRNTISTKIEITPEEKIIIDKYYLYFRFPLTAKSLSSSLSLIAISAFIWTPWLIYQQLWVSVAVIATNYFLAQYLSTKLNIRFYLHDAVEIRGKEEYRHEMVIVDSICEKLSAVNTTQNTH